VTSFYSAAGIVGIAELDEGPAIMTTAECLERIPMITANYGDASLLPDVLGG
jgi:hypothetical protein